jgi:hypothetical protein
MSITSYLDLYELLTLKKVPREENRAFGLSHILLKNKPVEQLLAWKDKHKNTLTQPTLGTRFNTYLYSISLLLVLLALVMGLFSGFALLSYNGHEPVNVVYYMAMVVFFPLLTMGLTLLSMFRVNAVQSLLVHVSPAFWMEKLIAFLPLNIQKDINSFRVNHLLANWLVIKRSQVIALFFSLGLFLALLAMVVTKDIAFAWSTTLSVTPEGFQGFLNTLAFAWRDWLPSAVPSVDLIQSSQYFRLGDKLGEEMIANAAKLGQWWKFLAMATLFYALLLRFFMYVLSYFGFKKAVKKSLLTLEGASTLLGEMNAPIISTHAQGEEEVFVQNAEDYARVLSHLDASYDVLQGWAIASEQLAVLSDSMGVIAPKMLEVGGANSFEEDSEVISKSKGEVLFFVKGWEPPTMDFVDYIEELCKKVNKVVLVPVGTAENAYIIKPKAIDVWDRKLSQLDEEKVWLKR